MADLLPTRSKQRVHIVRRMSMETYMVRIYPGSLTYECEFTSIEAEKTTSALEIVAVAVNKLRLGSSDNFELAEVLSTGGQLCKERRLEPSENPVRIQLLWPKIINAEMERGTGLTGYRFYLRKKDPDNHSRTSSWQDYHDITSPADTFLTSFLQSPTNNKEYPDLCNLPDLNERTLLDNIKSRYHNSNIYTYVGSILIAVNPFKFFPIYNPKYVKLYQNKRLGELPPHIFAIADAAFYTMLRTKKNQCIVISGESGSGKTESTNLLLHHLTALSQKGTHGSGVEQTILGAGPVLEAFGNAKTVHNNNSSRFGKFIQVNYKENGMVHGAIVEKYLLEKSRIVHQARNERNYHVFYYLLAGADEQEREALHLRKPEEYHYLRQSGCYHTEGVDEAHEFARLRQSLEMVGFSPLTQRRIFCVLSAVLLLGNMEFKKKGDQHHDESVAIKDETTIQIISSLLKVKEKTLTEALTQKKTTAGGETMVINYKMVDALANRDTMAKCLYGALFDWIVLKVNQALLAKRHNSEHQGNSIGVLDIFGFEDFKKNSFEQFCINYANEHLQYYFNQHIFKFEQEEYKKEGIQWKNIEFIDNTGCLELFASKSDGLLCLLDDECNFPGATNETLLANFNHHHKGRPYYQVPQLKEGAFEIMHYAGKVKYQVKDFREKNSDQIRMDIVSVLKSSNLTFVRELMGIDPVAVLRWSIVKTLVKSVFAFIAEGKKFRSRGGLKSNTPAKNRRHSDYIMPEALAASENLLNVHSASYHRHQAFSGQRSLSPLHEHQYFACTVDTFEDGCSDDDADDDIFIRSLDYVTDEKGDLVLTSPVELYLPESAKLIRRSTKIILKNKSFRPKPKPPTMLRDIKTLKQIASRTMYGRGSRDGSRKQMASVSAQFTWSLHRLMATLNQANPFFIRCIKSNPDKAPCVFDDAMVLRQLRYTGMLATVKIRQSGYNYRLTFDEFIQIYKILLPKGLLSSKEDVKAFLEERHLNSEHYQIGITKVFLRESEKMRLDEALHGAIMQRVVKIQRWFKTNLERQTFLKMRAACIVIQVCGRRFIAQRRLRRIRLEKEAALVIQKCYRCWSERRRYLIIVHSVTVIQSLARAYAARKQYKKLLADAELRRIEEEEKLRKKQQDDLHSSNSDEGILTKGSSAEELDEKDYPNIQLRSRDSDESSGIHEADESDSETLAEDQKQGSVVTLPQTPTTPDQDVLVRPAGKTRDDEYLHHSHSSSRVSDLAKAFQTDGETKSDRPLRPSIVVERGHQPKRRPKNSPAPLAKQESFSDLESSPTSPDTSVISRETLQEIDDCLKKNKDRQETPQQPLSPTGDLSKNRSPFRRARRQFKNIMGGFKTAHILSLIANKKGKKDSQDDSDEDEVLQQNSSADFHTRIGVSVLPVELPAPKSPTTRKGSVQGSQEDLSSVSNTDRPDRKGRKKRQDRKPVELEKKSSSPQRNEWTLSGTSLWQYPEDLGLKDISEILQLDEFIHKKLSAYNKDCARRDTIFDAVFKRSLKEFHRDMQALISVEKKKIEIHVPYRNIFAKFVHTLDAEVKAEGTNASFPVTMGINAFRGFMDEFIKNHKKEKKKEDRKTETRAQKREHKKKDVLEYQGHKFSLVQFGIPTFCEFCSNIIWIMEKGSVCQVCKYTCHRKCVTKSGNTCKGVHDTQAGTARCVFGAPLASLISEKDKIPVVVGKLINLVELHGLYTVGVYRKSGANAKVKLLKQNLDCGKEDLSDIDLVEFNVHTLASTLKKYFVELPEPLLTFDLYDDFIRTTDIQDEKERIQSLYAVIDKLPKINFDLFERLIFHLARVAHHEAFNKMSVTGLSIIFAPCLLRTSRNLQAQDSLSQVPRQTKVINHIIQEQLYKLKSTLEDISTLETAAETATDRLNVVRASMRKSPIEEKKRVSGVSVTSGESLDGMTHAEEMALRSHIRSIRKEKDNLTSNLPNLECRHLSSDDEVLSTDDMDSTYDTADDFEDQEEYALTFELPVSPPTQLKHMTKRRATLPPRRLPTRYTQAVKRRRHSEDSYGGEDLVDSGEHGVNDPVSPGNYDAVFLVGQGRIPSYDSSYLTIPGLQNIGEEDEIMV
ncbi:unconventional myosin-IXa-like isoform X2 [Mizuhopecten yessoensis]|uniref:unconventional myosin-IXa-like isoform X2 n=1 Tax=Mizuhopecten yessoensis TaxID=6573 RepID=UPI000B45B2CD|nr:unconventional myosin-IXa-like isoform X2 [Mizuhopecten yessoensis]